MARDIPPAILGAIAEGRAILFLGAGASYGALLAGQPTKLTVDKVKNALSEKYLGGAFRDRPLMTVADFARNESSLFAVQTTVQQLFQELEPNDFHCLIPLFRWKAIVTTNYDLVVERAFSKTAESLQHLATVTKDGPQLQDALSQQNTVPYLKLHGCINHYTDTKVPIVLDSMEYSKFSQGRTHMLVALKEWAVNHPILFCGYSLSDENIKQILFDIGDASQVRPQYLYVNPGLTDIENRYWSARRIAPYSGTFAEMLAQVDAEVPKSKRTLAGLFSSSTLTISKWIPSHATPSAALIQYLSQEVKHVLPQSTASAKADASAFFAGLDVSFDPIYAGFDIRREQVDDLLGKVVLDTLKSTLPKFFVLRGYAGCGKSVLARRLAVETAGLLDAPLVVYLPEGAALRENLLLELQRLVAGRLYVFLDDLIEFGDTLPHFLEKLRADSVPITVFACARTNEFNVFGSKYAGMVSRDFEIGDLEEPEITELLKRLSENRLLGPLETYDESERSVFVEKFYGRQLLVALHEITRGSPFEEIIVDEFEKITSREAQQLYLDICTLHQCRVAARAGLISRLSGLHIESLKSLLTGSLSNVVRESYDHRYRDIVYRSRHEEIARMVFDLAIPDADHRSLQLQRILGNMDLDYSSDNKAFFELLKGRRLAEAFERKGLALAVFDAAEAASPPGSYLLHQRAILELNHKDGNLEAANDLLRRAEVEVRREGFGDASIQHTRANLLRRRANAAHQLIEKERYRADARAILRPQLGQRDNSYPEVLYGQLLLDEIRDALDRGLDTATAGREAMSAEPHVRLINELSSLLDRSLQHRPTDGPMTLLKADFLKVLGKSPNAIRVLEKYCEKNDAGSLIVKVLAETLIAAGRIGDAVSALRPAVIAAAGDKALNLAMAKALIALDENGNGQSIVGHLRRSFSDGDSNYEARLLFARCNMLYGDLERGKDEFASLRRLYIDSREKARVPVLNSDGTPRRYLGWVATRQFGYGFIASNDLRFDVFFHKNHTGADTWEKLNRGSNVTFSLGFSFRGPVPVDIELA